MKKLKLMKKYIFRIRQCGEEDGSSVWTRANSKEEAEANIRHDYHSIDDLYLVRVEDD